MIIVETLDLIQAFKIFDDKKEEINFRLWDKQLEVYQDIHTLRYIIILKPRQFGMSIFTGGDSILQCALQSNYVFLCLSVTSGDSAEYLKKAYTLYKTLPEWVKTINPIIKSTQEELEFASGSRFVSLPASKGYGYTADRVVIDEFFKINPRRSKINIKEVLDNIMPTLDKRKGQLILLGTADGMNLQRDMYLKAKQGLSNFKSIFISCWNDPNMTPEGREKKIADLEKPEDGNQAYPRTDREAFLSSGRPRFNISTLEKFYDKNAIVPVFRGNINSDRKIERNEKGYIKFFRKYKVRGQYFLSGDVAEGLDKGDFSVAKVFDLETQEQVAEWHGHIEHAEFGTEVYKLAIHYNNAIIAVEANNHGHTTLERIVTTHKYPKILIHKSKLVKTKPDDKFRDPEKRLGWYTSGLTKPIIINNLSQKIEDKEATFFNKEDIDELYSYIKEKNGSTNAESGKFDDRVMALAIAHYLFKFYFLKIHKERHSCNICKYCDKDNCDRTNRLITNPNSICNLFTEDLEWTDTPRNLRRFLRN